MRKKIKIIAIIGLSFLLLPVCQGSAQESVPSPVPSDTRTIARPLSKELIRELPSGDTVKQVSSPRENSGKQLQYPGENHTSPVPQENQAGMSGQNLFGPLPGEPLLMLAPVAIDAPLMLTAGSPLKIPEFKMPEFALNRWTIDYSTLLKSESGSFFIPFGGVGAVPLTGYGAILNQASYRLSERLTVGGNSFGVNSILTAPLPKQGATRFDRYGASMFMEYKVNDNFRIGTRVSVSGSPHQP